MKICSPHCGAEPGTASGGEAYERELLGALDEAGDEVHVILAAHKTPPPGTRVLHNPVIRRGLRWPVAAALFPSAIWRCWTRCGGFDLLRAHSTRFTGPACLIAKRLGVRAPLVTHCHHLDDSPLNRVLERPVLRASDLVITDSQAARAQLLALGVPKEKIRVVYSGIADRYRPAAARPVGPGRVLLVACGHLIPRKDPHFALDVMAGLRARGHGDRVRLIWIGDGSLRTAVARRIADEGLCDMVKIEGRVPEATKLALFQAADVFLHTATLEGFALAPQEAMACGVPVVMRNAASAAEMVTDFENGLLVDSVESAVGRLEILLAAPDLRRQLGRAAAQRADRDFRWPRTVKGVRAVYEEAVCSAK